MVSTKAGDRPLSGGEQVQQLKDSPLWGHLRSVLMQYLEEQPEAPMDIYDAVHQLVLKGTMTPVPPSCGTVPMHSSSPAKHLSAAEMLNQYRFSVDLRNRMKDPLWAKNYLDLVVTPVKKRRAGASEDDEGDEDGNGSSEISEKVEMEDVVSIQNLLSEVGSGLDRATAQHVAVALRHLAQSEPVRSVRFWGCIFATQRTYFIAETQWSEERAEEMGNNAHGDHTEQSGNDENEGESSSAGSKSTQIVQLLNRYQLRLPHPVAAEEKTGTNLYRYFVMYSDQWMQWTILPDVRPEWIRCARTVHCFFKGDLDAPVSTHPPFPGRERHYLRAQIARITHSTLVAPKHALQREDGGPEDEEEEEEEGEEAPGNPNKGEKEGLPSPSTACATSLPLLKLVKPYAEVPPLVAPTTPEDDDEEAIAAVQDWYSGYANDVLMELRSWVHIAPRLLQGQARATLFTPENDNDADEEEESEDPNASDGPSSENTRRMGGVQQYLKQLQQGREERVPPILTPIAYDGVGLDTNTSMPTRGMIHARTHPWCVRKAFTSLSASSRTYAVKSTLWPGATCVARVEDGTPGVLYQNVYLGMGLKARDGSRYTPPIPTSHTMLEFPCRHDVLHSDATLEEEEVYMVLPTQETDNVMGRDHDAAGEENAEDADDA